MINIRKLNCGVRIVMEKMEDVQSAAIGIWVKAGAVNEIDKYAGVSHFIEHMMFKGTENRTAKQIAEEIDKTGGQINAFTGREVTCYYVKSLSSNLLKSSEVLVDMLANSLFDKEEMNRERQVICEEIKMSQDAPDELAQDLICKIVNENSKLGNSIIGTPTTLKHITRNVLTNYIKEQYTRDSIVVAVAGNFDEDEICEFLETKFDKFEATKPKLEIEAHTYEPRYKVKVKDIEQTHIFLGRDGYSYMDEEYYTATIVSNILGGSMSSRLFQSVREQKGLAYSIYAVNAPASIGGNVYIYAGVGHDNFNKAVYAIKDELVEIKNHGVTTEELDKAKEQLKASFIFGQENIATKMFSLGRSLLLTENVRTDKEVLVKIDSITLDEANEVAEKIGDASMYSIATVTNKRRNVKHLLR